MSELIDRQALENWLRTECYGTDTYDDKEYVIGRLREELPTIPAPRWARCEDELPDDGEWAIFTNGKVVTVERFKLDAYNHFFPASQWFDFEDAIAWMPLHEPPKEDA